MRANGVPYKRGDHRTVESLRSGLRVWEDKLREFSVEDGGWEKKEVRKMYRALCRLRRREIDERESAGLLRVGTEAFRRRRGVR